MEQQEQKPRLITSRFGATVAVVLTGYVAALSLRSAFWQSQHSFQWLLPPIDHLFPAWAVVVSNVAVYAWLLWICIVFPRALGGKERILVAGLAPGVLFSPIQGLVSKSFAVAIQYFKAISIVVAFFAALVILLERTTNGRAHSEGTVAE